MNAPLPIPLPVFADAADCADVVTLVLATDSQHKAPRPAAKHYTSFSAAATRPELGFGLAVQIHVPDVKALAPNIKAVGGHEFLVVVPSRFPGYPVWDVATINDYGALRFFREFGLRLGTEDWLAGNPGSGNVARLKRLMEPSSYIVLDHDIYPHTPPRWHTTPERWLRELAQELTGLADAPALMVPSNSARITDGNGEIRSPGRCAVWVQTTGASSSELRDQARIRVKQLLIACGHGWAHDRRVSIPIDLATWTVGQASYAGKPTVAPGSGLCVLDVDPVVLNSDAAPWDLASLPAVSKADYLRYEQQLRPGVKISLSGARTRQQMDVYDLSLGEPAELEDGSVATLGEVRELLRAGAGKVRMQSPFRPESSSCAAYAGLSKNGDLLVVDSADPTVTHWLAKDEQAIEEFSKEDSSHSEPLDDPEAQPRQEKPATARFDGLADMLAPLNSSVAVEDFHPHVVDRILPESEVTLLGGHGGSGKTTLALQIGINVALGQSVGPLEAKQGRVLFVSAEDGADAVRRTLRKCIAAAGMSIDELDGQLDLLDMSEIDPTLHDGDASTRLLESLSAFVAGGNYKLVILDNASELFAGEEIRRREVRGFIRGLRQRIARPSRAVLLLAHVDKSTARAGGRAATESYSGSTAWHNSVRSRCTLSMSDDPDRTRFLSHDKANYGEQADQIRFTWKRGVPRAVGEATGVDDPGTANLEQVLALITFAAQVGDPVTTATQGSYTTFGRLKIEPGFPPGLDKHGLIEVLRHLESTGRIKRGQVKKHRRSKDVFLPATDALNSAEGGS
jgi:hypothetical protein